MAPGDREPRILDGKEPVTPGFIPINLRIRIYLVILIGWKFYGAMAHR